MLWIGEKKPAEWRVVWWGFRRLDRVPVERRILEPKGIEYEIQTHISETEIGRRVCVCHFLPLGSFDISIVPKRTTKKYTIKNPPSGGLCGLGLAD